VTNDQPEDPMTTFDVEALRRRFPALSIEQDGRPVALFDGPGGTQVPQAVIDAVATYYRASNANTDGAFLTSARSDEVIAGAHTAIAEMLGAADASEIKFGANMTSLTLHISRSIAATMAAGDEIVVTGLDHHGNVDPWLRIAADRGLTIRTWEPRLDDCTLDLADLDRLLGPRTKLVAVGWASNAVGTINQVDEIVRRAHAAGAWTYVDAVHAAPHLPIDVQALGTDFLACSTYKFFGPHAGVLYGRAAILDALPTYKLVPAHDRFETGTQNHEGMAGVIAAVDYLAEVGVSHGGASTTAPLGERVRAAMRVIRGYEMALYRRLVDGLEAIDGVRLYGITDRARFDDRTPTAALTIEGLRPRAVSEALGRLGIATWDGDFYATGLIDRLGLAESGGVVRIGLTHYNTADEIDRVIGALAGITEGVAVA
jgi:cysteine desulfurase family protein (TIGR01976 family)